MRRQYIGWVDYKWGKMCHDGVRYIFSLVVPLESFQDQEYSAVFRHCNENLLEHFSYTICWNPFHSEMTDINKELWCEWDQVIRYT